MHWDSGDRDRFVQLTQQYMRDESFPDEARRSFCKRAASHLAQSARFEEAIDTARYGILLNPDPDLVWLLVRTLHAAGRIEAARETLRSHRPYPVSEEERYVWLQLLAGSELHEDDARTLLKMIGEQNPGPIRSRMVALLRQEVLPPNESEQIQFPPDLVEAVSTAFASDGLLEGPLVDGQGSTERPETGLVALSPAEHRKNLINYAHGRISSADVARALNHSWSLAIIQRPSGVTVGNDLTPGLRTVGRHAAREAIRARSCALDLPAIHTLARLPADDQLRIRGQIIRLATPASFARDISQGQGQVRAIALAERSVGVNSNGDTVWMNPPLQAKALLRESILLMLNWWPQSRRSPPRQHCPTTRSQSCRASMACQSGQTITPAANSYGLGGSPPSPAWNYWKNSVAN